MAQKHVNFLRFNELDDALFYLETTSLESNGYTPKQEPVQLIDQQLLNGLSQQEVDELTKHLIHKRYAEGEVIIKKREHRRRYVLY